MQSMWAYNGMSPSSRRAWIEINRPVFSSNFASVALLAEGVDRNQIAVDFRLLVDGSPSSRRAWIEIEDFYLNVTGECVALLAEGVDRN